MAEKDWILTFQGWIEHRKVQVKRILLSPEPFPALKPPDQKAQNYEVELEDYRVAIEQQKFVHEELSKTIRRTFYMLLLGCLYCILTLSSVLDSQMLAQTSSIILPVFNYEIQFKAFLMVGPVLLIGITAYLHILVGEHRRLPLSNEKRLPMLVNFDSCSARSVIFVIFYWLTPVTLVIFSWKSLPLDFGPTLYIVALMVTGTLTFIQIRRSPVAWRWRAILCLIFSVSLFIYGTYILVGDRKLNLFRVDLSGQDLRHTTLSEAFMMEAKLKGANLERVHLILANLFLANLEGANLKRANLAEANLELAKLNGANLERANLEGAKLGLAKLNGANLKWANLEGANLVRADLIGANLKWAKLNGANLEGANLEGANLEGAKNIPDSAIPLLEP